MTVHLFHEFIELFCHYNLFVSSFEIILTLYDHRHVSYGILICDRQAIQSTCLCPILGNVEWGRTEHVLRQFVSI